MRSCHSGICVLMAFASVLIAVYPVKAEPFTAAQRDTLAKELQDAQSTEQAAVDYDRCWDVWLKVIVLLIAVLTAVGTGYAGTYSGVGAPGWLRIVNFSFAALTAGLGTLVSQLDLTAKQINHQRKASTFQHLADVVQYTEPNRQMFLDELRMVRESTDPNQPLILQSTQQAQAK